MLSVVPSAWAGWLSVVCVGWLSVVCGWLSVVCGWLSVVCRRVCGGRGG